MSTEQAEKRRMNDLILATLGAFVAGAAGALLWVFAQPGSTQPAPTAVSVLGALGAGLVVWVVNRR